MISVKKVSQRFGDVQALKDISFQITQAQIVGILGPNGAGKTTLIRILTGIFPPSDGRVLIHGQELFKHPEVKKNVGYLAESNPLYKEMRVSDYLNFVCDLKKINKSIRKKQMDDVVLRCDLGTVRKKKIGILSKGFQQRVGLAQALLGEPNILVLDEPMNGLDPEQIIEIRGLIQELGKNRTVIVSSHILSEVEISCERLLVLTRGALVADGTVEELKKNLELNSQESNLEQVFLKLVNPKNQHKT